MGNSIRKNFARFALCALVSSSVAAPALRGQQAQQTAKRKPSQTDSREQSPQKRAASQNRQRAIETLREVAESAKSFDDAAARAEILASVADALWKADQAEARALFRKAWQAAQEAEPDRTQTGTRVRPDANQPSGNQAPTVETESARDEVLSRVMNHEGALAKEFLREASQEKTPDAAQDSNAQAPGSQTSNAQRKASAWHEPSAAGAQLIEYANQSLMQGASARAADALALAVSEGVSGDLIAALIRLRQQDARRADELFDKLLDRTRAGFLAHDDAADANAVLLLSSYVDTPQLLAVVGDDGAIQMRALPQFAQIAFSAGDAPASVSAAPINSSVREKFYSLAAQILLQSNQTTQANSGGDKDDSARYYAIARLQPFFERDAPQLASAVAARRESLVKSLADSRRKNLDSQSDTQTLSGDDANDPLRADVRALKAAEDESQRDRIRARLVKTAARYQMWDRARNYARQIQEKSLSRDALAFIAVCQIAALQTAYEDAAADDYERAARFVRDADAPAFVRAWGLAQAAQMADKRANKQRAAELLNEAAANAASCDSGSRERVAAYVAVTRAAAHINPSHALELLGGVVAAANGVQDYREDVEFSVAASDDDSAASDDAGLLIASAPFRVAPVFAALASVDFARTIEAARTISDAPLRARALVAAAATELNK